MNRHLDIEQLLETWLDEGPTDTADAVFDSAVARVYRQRQRPAWRFLRKEPTAVLTPIKLMLAAAAFFVVAVVGGSFLLSRPGQVGGPPSPSPSPIVSPSPSTSPSAGAVFPEWYTDAESARQGGGSGILSAGTHTTHGFVTGSRLTVPDGWVNDTDHPLVYALFPMNSANEAQYALVGETAQNILLTTQVANNMFVICETTGLLPSGTAAQVIDAVLANKALSATEPVDVTIGGLSGLQVDVQLNPDWIGSCPVKEKDPNRDWADGRNRLIVLDAPNRSPIGIAISSKSSADAEPFLAEAMAIIESFEFNLDPAPSPS